MNYKITITHFAQECIEDVSQYIAVNLQSPVVAAKQISRIYDAIFDLAKLPLIHPKYDVEPWLQRGMRKLVVDNYLVFYTVDEQQKQVVVIMVSYAGRNVEALLKNVK